MATPVPLARIVDALESLSEESQYYLHKPTGEVIMVSQDDLAAAEEGEVEDIQDLPDWRRQGMQEASQVLESDDYVRLPSKFDVHDWDIMRRFCYQVEDDELSQALLNAIHRRGAFRFFRHLVHENGIERDWYAFRESVLEEIAIDWLVANHIPYTREKPEYSEGSEDEE